MEILIQIIGFVAVAVGIIAVQFNTHSKIMFFKTLGSLIFAVQFAFLGAFTGMVMEILGAIRNIIFAYNVKKGRSNKWWIVVFCALICGIGILTVVLSWDTTMAAISKTWTSNQTAVFIICIIASILSILSKFISTIAFSFKSPHKIRVTTIPACSMWLIYNIFVFNLAEIICEIMCISSNIIAEVRFRKSPDGTDIPNTKHIGACDCASCNAMLMGEDECDCHDHHHHDEHDHCDCDHDHHHDEHDHCDCDHDHNDEDANYIEKHIH